MTQTGKKRYLSYRKRIELLILHQRNKGRETLLKRSEQLQKLAVIDETFRHWIELGCFFGYPDCCIIFFCTEWTGLVDLDKEDRRHVGPDRILCHECCSKNPPALLQNNN